MPYSELKAIFDLLAMLFFDWRIGALTLLLATAAIIDCRSRRIPNWLVLSGALFGIAYNTILPPSANDNILFSLLGLALGLALFLPLYAAHAMGAGDVKLVAMVGAFLGPRDTFYAVLASMIAGGALAILFVFARGTALRMLQNIMSIFRPALYAAIAGARPVVHIEPLVSAGKLPYGVAIASGTIGSLVLRQLGFL